MKARRKCNMKHLKSRLPGVGALPVVLILALLALSSCHSLFNAALGSMVGHEKEKATAEAESETPEKPASSAQSAPKNIDPSVHRIVGAWENAAYNNEGRSARVVFSLNADGSFTYLAFDRLDGSGEVYEGVVAYIKTWIDDEGRSCGESTVTLNNGMSWNTLDRISVDGNTLEVQSGVRKINPNGPRYSIYYRP
jgi:hypothetical protein